MVDRLSGKGQRTSAASPLIGRTDELLAASELLDSLSVGVATLRYLRALAASDPVVLAIDDLQWLDAPSGRAVEFALRRLGDERVGLFATVRAPASARLPLEVDRCVAPERCRKLTLGPLSLGAVYVLLRTRLGLSLPRPLLAK